MSVLVAAILWLPGVAGLVLWLVAGRPWQIPLARLAAVFQGVLALTLLASVSTGEIGIHLFGDWPAPFGIAFAADRLSGLFVALQALLLGLVVATLRPERHGPGVVERALPLLFLLSFGLHAAFLTADLFNLFVAFEVVLLASYLLLQVPGNERSVKAAFPNVAINLLGSLLFFLGVALLYGLFGTVHLADLSTRIAAAPSTLSTLALGMLTLAFGIKAGLVPLMFWLPASYPALSGPVAALFAGMMTKLGVFALLRTVPLLHGGTTLPTLLIWVGAASALLGVLAALSEYELRRLLGFHIVSQVGYMILGLGFMTVGALAAAFFYLIHHIVVKAALFLVADELERRSGSRDLRRMGVGAKGLAWVFLLPALSLAGMPPLSGFFAKLGLFRTAVEAQNWPVLAVLVVASFFTLASMLKIWQFAFVSGSQEVTETRERAGWPLIALVAVSLGIAVASGPIYEFALATAQQLLDVSVLSEVPQPGGHPATLIQVPQS